MNATISRCRQGRCGAYRAQGAQQPRPECNAVCEKRLPATLPEHPAPAQPVESLHVCVCAYLCILLCVRLSICLCVCGARTTQTRQREHVGWLAPGLIALKCHFYAEIVWKQTPQCSHNAKRSWQTPLHARARREDVGHMRVTLATHQPARVVPFLTSLCYQKQELARTRVVGSEIHGATATLLREGTRREETRGE